MPESNQKNSIEINDFIVPAESDPSVKKLDVFAVIERICTILNLNEFRIFNTISFGSNKCIIKTAQEIQDKISFTVNGVSLEWEEKGPCRDSPIEIVQELLKKDEDEDYGPQKGLEIYFG